MFAAVMVFALGFLVAVVTAMREWRARERVSLSLILLGGLAAIHGIPALVYLFVNGPGTYIFEEALTQGNPAIIKARVLVSLALTFISVVAGMALVRVFLPRLHALESATADLTPADGLDLAPASRFILWVIAAGMLGVSLLEDQLPRVFEYFTIDATEIARILLRTEQGGSPYYLYNVLLAGLAPYLAMVALVSDMRATPARLPLLGLALVLAVLLGKFATLSKAPPVVFVLQLLLLYLLLGKHRFNVKRALVLVTSATILFSVIVSLTIPELDARAVLAFLYYRVFDIPNEALLEYFAAIPASIPFGFESGLSGWLGPERPNELPTYLGVAEITRGTLMSTSNVMFAGDAWAQFAWPGVVLAGLAMGFTVKAIDLFAYRHGNGPAAACMVAGCAYGVFAALSTSMTTAWITGGLMLIPIASVLLGISGRSAGRVAAWRVPDAAH